MDYPLKTVSQLRPMLLGFRKNAGLTQEDLAQRLGISQQSYAAFEANPAAASVDRLFRVLRLLAVELHLAAGATQASPVRRAAVVKEPVVKKAAIKKNAAKKTPAKKAPVKKAVLKKAASRPVAVKKPKAKAAAGQRAVVKKTPKTAAKPVVSRKTAARSSQREDW